MNTENIQRVRQRIESLRKDEFDMTTYTNLTQDGRPCGCIAYWTLRELLPGSVEDIQHIMEEPEVMMEMPETAQQELGLDTETARWLFLYGGWPGRGEDIRPQDAVQALERLLQTGRAHWGTAAPRWEEQEPEPAEKGRDEDSDLPF